MRLELTRVGLLAELANHYTTRGALVRAEMTVDGLPEETVNKNSYIS